ncbi:hypothetical protein [Methyloterricola oryzae]|uniref:hypothetical protein n=1 Tax=Methyloterricola oryzae TaxID=1495050 RepID=UPI0005EBCB5A|nr:hypothetical protein [Methyloterricola oryzae]
MKSLASHCQSSRNRLLTSVLKFWQLLLLTFTLCLIAHPASTVAAKQKATPEKTDACLAGVPVTAPIPPAVRVVQLVNCSTETILGAANAAKNDPNGSLTSIFPREGTWVMKPAGSPNNANVITLDIPPEWADTKKDGSVAPNI